MLSVEIPRFDGNTDSVEVYSISTFPYDKLSKSRMKCNNKRKCESYSSTFATFDIETTTIKGEAPYGFMYHWQMTVGGIVCIGRRWEEWITFIRNICDILEISASNNLVIYVHNLAFEFQFIRDFLVRDFDGFTVFASQRRKPITVQCGNGVQFRCSYKLTNMSLEKAVENEQGCIHCKAVGDLDYKKLRTPDTRLTKKELGYCVADVVTLHELIENRLKNEHDNLESIPMTSTGYVRRLVKKSCREDAKYRNLFLKTKMTVQVYTLLKEASRGGNTHANRYMSGKVWKNADSYDAQSEYPFCLIAFKYPITAFTPYGNIDSTMELDMLLEKYACLFRLTIVNPHLNPCITMPYIPVSKCLHLSSRKSVDNGRVLTADYLTITITDIDFKIIREQYDWDSIAVADMHIADYDYLPEAFLKPIRRLYYDKCDLKDRKSQAEKGSEEEENLKYLYDKQKNLLNGCFGMTFTDPVRSVISIDENGKWLETDADIASSLEKFYKSRNSFLYYAWGVWCTAWGRLHLQHLIDGTGAGTIYCDTDSSKAIAVDHLVIEKLNNEIIALDEQRHAYADVGGNRYYLGIYEHENEEPIMQFKTLGAKKYCYKDSDGLHLTVSGVSKKDGAKELKRMKNFKIGFVFRKAGGLELQYNDNVPIHTKVVNGCTFTTASNVAMLDSTYTLGITEQYAEILGINLNDYT